MCGVTIVVGQWDDELQWAVWYWSTAQGKSGKVRSAAQGENDNDCGGQIVTRQPEEQVQRGKGTYAEAVVVARFQMDLEGNRREG
ncbi:hypothetical protein V6N13_105229 [Hibiscus sabdariffa]|uniref:Uncharacterized protein n=1 Tax=Hibiscus sabdariffa TaxID=183260 RepID=A0ABR2EXV7_9ROSI